MKNQLNLFPDMFYSGSIAESIATNEENHAATTLTARELRQQATQSVEAAKSSDRKKYYHKFYSSSLSFLEKSFEADDSTVIFIIVIAVIGIFAALL
jgi:hypothetical protein